MFSSCGDLIEVLYLDFLEMDLSMKHTMINGSHAESFMILLLIKCKFNRLNLVKL